MLFISLHKNIRDANSGEDISINNISMEKFKLYKRCL